MQVGDGEGGEGSIHFVLLILECRRAQGGKEIRIKDLEFFGNFFVFDASV